MNDNLRKTHTPGVNPLPVVEQRRKDALLEAQQPGLWEGFKSARQLEATGPNILRAIGREDHAPDPDFLMTEDLWTYLTTDIKPEFQSKFLDVQSEAQARQLRDNILFEQGHEAELGKLGLKGLGLRVTAALFDETALAAIIASEGVAAPWILASKATRLTRAIRSGIVGSGSVAAIEGTLYGTRETKDPQDILWGAAAGAALGMGIGAILRPRPGAVGASDDIQEASGRLAREIEDQEIRQARIDLEGPPNWKADIKAAERNLEDLETQELGLLAQLDEAAKARRALPEVSPQGAAEVPHKVSRTDQGFPRGLGHEARALDDEITRLEKELDDLHRSGVLDDADEAMDPGAITRHLKAQRQAEAQAAKIDEKLSALTQKRLEVEQLQSRKPVSKTTKDVDEAFDLLEATQPKPRSAEDAFAEKELLDQREALDTQINALNAQLDELGGTVAQARQALRDKYQEGFGLMFIRSRVQAATTPEEELARVNEDVIPMGLRETAEDAFGPDSAGAARNPSSPEEIIDTDLPPEAYRNAQDELQDALDNSTTTGQRIGHRLDALMDYTRYDVLGRLLKSKSGVTRFLARKLGEDAAPSGYAETSAALIADRNFSMMMTRFYRDSMPAYKAWAKENGYRWYQSVKSREDFFSLVSHEVRVGGSVDPFVKQAAQSIQKANREILEKVKAAGVKGFDNITPNDNYLTRLWKPGQFSRLNEEIGANDVRKLIKTALLRGSSGMDDELAGRMAATVFTRFLRKSVGLDADFNRMFFGRDVNLLAKVLRDSGADEESIGRVIAAMKNKESTDKLGTTPRAKFKMGLDEDTTIRATNGRQVHISELFENNAETLHSNYIRNMSGHMAMAEKGFKSEADFHRMVEAARSQGATEDEVGKLMFLHKAVMGKPLENNPGGNWSQTARLLRDWNFMRVMGQVGWAQLAEIGNITGQLGWRSTIAHVPQLRSMIKRTQNGDIDHKLIREMEETLGSFGNDRLLHQPHFRHDDVGAEVFGTNGILSKIDNFTQQSKRTLADVSLMAPINIGLQRVAAVGIAQKFLNIALKATPSASDLKRLASLGLDEEMTERVLKSVKDHSSATKNALTGRKLNQLNLDQWGDLEAREAFAYAVNRWAHRVIQKNLPGETPEWMHSTLGKVLGQFRTFMLTAYGKQLLHNVKMNDWSAYSAFMGSMLFGGLAYYTQTVINSAGRADQDEYLKERLSAKAIGLSAFQRAGFASVIPAAIDSTAGWTPFLDEPLFAYGRTTGLASDLLLGNPTVDVINKVSGATKGVLSAPTRGDYDWSQKDQRNTWGLLFFANTWGMRNLNELMLQDLPYKSTTD